MYHFTSESNYSTEVFHIWGTTLSCLQKFILNLYGIIWNLYHALHYLLSQW